MFQIWKKICVFLIICAAAAISVSAQNSLDNIDGEVYKTLVTKDLRLMIKEAERSPANDLSSLLWRLNLYRRIVNNEKIALTVRQISENPEFEKNRPQISSTLKYVLQNEFFKDAETLQIYLQKINFNRDVYSKFSQLCQINKNNCDISGFDRWLAQKVSESAESKDENIVDYQNSGGFDWLGLQIEWRRKFGLDDTEILNGILDNVRKNPNDLDVALRYLYFFKTRQEINWLLENFTSEQAYDYYELGERIYLDANYLQISGDERKQIYQVAARFLQKSLALPFTEKDKNLIWTRQFRFASISPVIKNPEKQLRFWTKKELAAAYKNAGEPQNAQPLVEELMNTDTSDITSGKPSGLAGAVQAASGARAVESKILSEQGARQNSVDYWFERIAYYQGRQENERVFEAYKQLFAILPPDLSNKASDEGRLYVIRNFVDFVKDEFGNYDDDEPEELSVEEKIKLAFWKDTESFLRNEFEKTKTKPRYSHELTEIIVGNYKNLFDELFTQNPQILADYAENDLLDSIDDVFYYFIQSEKIPQNRKNPVIERIIKIAEKKDVKKAWILCEILADSANHPATAAQVIPILMKNLKLLENNPSRIIFSDDDDYEVRSLKNLKNKYIEVLFDAYLTANDWKSAERMVLKQDFRGTEQLIRIAVNASKNGASADATRLWKQIANFDRSNLSSLQSVATNQTVKDNLREFYQTMKVEEPFSPIPEKALNILK